jgi:hypothetical protein
MLGAYSLGAGKIILNTFSLLDQVDKHPAADRLLLNLLSYAAETTQSPPAPTSDNFDALMKEMGY